LLKEALFFALAKTVTLLAIRCMRLLELAGKLLKLTAPVEAACRFKIVI
jgi:hypothetical protein